MGLGKWWITHGPGSPGSVAKAMAIAYSRFKIASPSFLTLIVEAWPQLPPDIRSAMSKDALLLATLRTRYSVYEIDNATANKMVKDSKGRLAKLTNQVISLEITAATGAMVNAPNVYLKMLEVVNEVTDKFAPGA